jgi:LuxR family maltose regulon positive regulatory protein
MISPVSRRRRGLVRRAEGDPRSALVAVAKLRAPAAREAVARPALVERLATNTGVRLTLVAAPAGWGKTTLLAAWARADCPHRFAWLSLDGWDNDPVRFWTYVVEALHRAEPALDTGARRELDRRGADILGHVLPLLVNELARLERDLVLVLDDLHLVTNLELFDQLAFLVG